MEKFAVHAGLVVPLDRANVDTDAIIPKQFLKSIKRTGFGVHLFDEWRYLDHGELDMDCSRRVLNPDFVLNQARYLGATILLTRKNFGCGSSREHAPWALQQHGFRAIIAPSFADIFYSNCLKIGLLPVVLPEGDIDNLFEKAQGNAGYSLTIDLQKQTLHDDSGTSPLSFHLDDFRRNCLLNGLDDIGLTLLRASTIKDFETKHLTVHPWLSC